MARLPAITRFADEILSARAGSHRVREASRYLSAHRTELSMFESVEHLAISTEDDIAPPGTTEEQMKAARALCHHLLTVRSVIARELWARQIFVGADVLDELLFWVLRETSEEPVHGALTWIRDSRSTRPGLLVFPIHSFGVLGAGLITPGRRSLSFINSRAGYAITPQTNGLVVRRGIGLGGQGGSAASDLGDDLVGGLAPDEGAGVVVPAFGPQVDGVDELGDAGEGAVA